jgi:hypothetical protein
MLIQVILLFCAAVISQSYLYGSRSPQVCKLIIVSNIDNHRRVVSRGATRHAAASEDEESDTKKKDDVPKGVFKISKPANNLVNFSPPSNQTPSPLSSQLIIVGGTVALLFAVAALFVFINKDVPTPTYYGQTMLKKIEQS